MPTFNLLDSIKQAQQARAVGQAQRRPAARACPPALTGGESTSKVGEGLGAKVDWLTATWKPEPDLHVGAMVYEWLTKAMMGVMGESVNGMFGYSHGVRFYIPQGGLATHVARVDWGGDHHGGRARIDISGAGCSRVTDWHSMMVTLAHLVDTKLTRVDLAVDLLNGEHTVEDAVQWYQAGDFSAGGSYPRHSCMGDWIDTDFGLPRSSRLQNPPKSLTPYKKSACGEKLDLKYGRTFMVGRRENGKALRVYEKGRQLGDYSSPWTRFEVEIRNKDRDIPLDILIRCDTYFTGAYNCLERILDVAATRIATDQKEGEISIEHLTEYARMSYGKLVHVLRSQVSVDDLLESITRPGIPKQLERASLGGFFNGPPTGLHH